MKTFVVTESWSFHMVPPARFLWLLPTATALLLLLTIAQHNRRKLLVLAAVFFTACLYMFNPLFYEVLMRLIPYWIISRMNYLAQIVAFVVIPGGLAWMLRRTLRTTRSRALLALTVLCCGLVLSYPRVRAHYGGVEKQHLRLARFEELRQALRPVLPGRALVAADPEMSRLLPALRVSAVMAPVLGTANPADQGVLRRHEDCREFLAAGTSDARRVELARQHGIAFVLIGTNWVDPPIFNSYRHENGFSFEGFSELVVEGDWFQLFRLRLDSSALSGQA